MEIVFNKVSFVINKNTPLEKTILNNVSFSITEPLIYSFIGSSNSGKTAIGELISFLHVPTKGDVKIGRYKNNGKNKKTIYKLKRQIGYVFKNPYDMFFNDTVLKEISYAIDEFGYKKESKDKRIIEALKLPEYRMERFISGIKLSEEEIKLFERIYLSVDMAIDYYQRNIKDTYYNKKKYNKNYFTK